MKMILAKPRYWPLYLLFAATIIVPNSTYAQTKPANDNSPQHIIQSDSLRQPSPKANTPALAADLLDAPTAADDSLYYANMLQGITIMDKAMDVGQLAQAALFFEDTYDQYPLRWLPSYYAAYCYGLMAFLEKNPVLKDNYLDNAQHWLDRANQLNPNNIEIIVVQALIYQERVQVNPAERMPEYGTLSIITLENAEQLDPNNPRIYYLRAQNMFLTPEIAGGGLQKACPLIEIAAQKYAAQQNDPNSIMPKWGRVMTDYMLQICNYGKK